MKCRCGLDAIYFRRYSGQKFCEDCFKSYFERKVLETIKKYRMVRAGERIGVAISGGKDSTVLLHIIQKLSANLGITIHPILIDEGIEGYRESGIGSAKNTCLKLCVPLKISSFKGEVGYTLDELLKDGNLKPCTYCGTVRRKILNQRAKELGLDRLAVGHNLDDEAQVVMMNYMSGDIERLHRLNGKTEDRNLVNRIKPLSRIPEKEVMIYALLNNLDISTDECPYSKENYRTVVRNFLNNLELERPGIKFSILSGWERLKEKGSKEGSDLRTCILCKQPASRKVCRACELIEEIKIKMSGAS